MAGRESKPDPLCLPATRILNYYNPDDFALASWKVDQALKPTKLNGTITAGLAALAIKAGNVDLLGSTWDKLMNWWNSLQNSRQPGFGNTQYVYNTADGKFYRAYMEYKWVDGRTETEPGQYEWVEVRRVPLDWDTNMYEMLAFCASSIVAPLGTTDWNNIPGVFSDGVDLRSFKLPDGTTKWNAKITGHSAQFVGSYIGVSQYWRSLLSDIGAAPLQALPTGPVAANAAVPMSAPTAEQESSQPCTPAATSRSDGETAELQVRVWPPQPLSYQSPAAELLAIPYAGEAWQGILDTEHPEVLA